MKILQDGKEISTISFGEVEIGQKKEIAVKLFNDGKGKLTELQFKVNPEITIELAPQQIAPEGLGELRLSWMPDLAVTQPIQVKLEITGKEVFG